MKLQQTGNKNQPFSFNSTFYQLLQQQQPYPNPKYNQQVTQSNRQESFLPNSNQTQPITIVHSIESSNELFQIIPDQAYKQHKQFLQRYKREREIQLQKKVLKQEQNESSSGEQERKISLKKKRCSSNIQVYQNHENNEIKQFNKQYIINQLEIIHNKIKEEIIQADDSRYKYKIFTDSMESKNDIQRVAKEKRFVRSQNSKEYSYQQPSMPSKNKLPLKFRIKTQSVYNQSQLCKKARNFISRIQNDQQNLLGKHLIRKKIESSKKEREQKEQIRKMIQLNEIKKQQRKSKAQQNILFLKEKVKISQLINFKNLQSINASRNPMPSYKRFNGDQIHNQILETRKSKMQQYVVKKNRYRKQANQDQDPFTLNIKQKIAIRKHKNLRPTQYHQVKSIDQGQNTTRSNKAVKRYEDGTFKEKDRNQEYQLQLGNQHNDTQQLQNQDSRNRDQFKNHYSKIQNSEINVQLSKIPSKSTNSIHRNKNYPFDSIQ